MKAQVSEPTFLEINNYLQALANSEIAQHSQRFFKTAKGEYGFGDIFLGIRVPIIRQAVKKFKTASLQTTTELLQSPYHEIRLFALLQLVQAFNHGDKAQQETIYQLYLQHTQFINNWDLVDSSAHKIVGAYLLESDRAPLYNLAKSDLLWERRIAIIATFAFVDNKQFDDSLIIAEILLNDEEDLIHKAVGWVLREVGKKDQEVEESFLKQHYQTMPRTMLRYAIEKFDEPLRKAYLKGDV